MAAEVFPGKDKILALTEEAHVSSASKNVLRAIGAERYTGIDVRAAFPQADEILYADISSVHADALDEDLTIYQGGRDLSELPNSSTSLTFNDASARDAALAALERHLAPRLQRREVQYGVVRAALGPLLLGVLIAAFAFVAFHAAALIAEGDEAYFYKPGTSARGRAFIPLLKLLGPTGVAILGGLAVLACIVELVERVRRPPLMITLSLRK
jgi:hypothetical protein